MRFTLNAIAIAGVFTMLHSAFRGDVAWLLGSLAVSAICWLTSLAILFRNEQ